MGWLSASMKVALLPIRFIPESPLKERMRASLMALSFRPPVFVLVNAGETVIQIGVAAAETVHRYSRAAGPTGRVILFEAAPDNVRMVREAIRTAPYPNVILIPKGAWNTRGTAALSLSPFPADNKIAIDGIVHDNDFRPENTYAQTVEIPVDTVDNVLEELGIDRVDYVSITVNGAELAVLEGCDRLLRQRGLRLWVKAHALKADGQPLNVAVMQMLLQRGFQVYKTASSQAVGENPEWKYRDGDVYAFRL